MSDIKDLKNLTKASTKGNVLSETDYVLRDKATEELGKNTIIMEDSEKYKDEIAKAKAELSGDERAKMKAELLSEIKAELKAEAKKDAKGSN